MAVQALGIAKSALIAEQAALNISSQNVANAETPGYVRETANLSPIVGNTRAGGEVGGIGNGVELTSVLRSQDACLTVQINAQTASQGRDQVIADTLSSVESDFSDATSDGISSALGDMFNAFGQLGANPSLTSARDDVIASCRTVADAITQRESAVQSAREELDTGIVADVQQVNELSSQIAKLNAAIGASDNSGSADGLMDQRDAAMTQLAGLCGAVAIPEKGNTIDVVIGGQRIVQDDRATALDVVPDATDPTMHQVSLDGSTDLRGLSGSIAGRLQARDGYLAGYVTQLNTLAKTVADEMNTQHEAGYDLNGDAGQALFQYDASAPAATLQVNETVAGDPNLIAAGAEAGVNGDGSNALALQDLGDKKVLGSGQQTLEDYNADLVAGVGSDSQHATTAADTRTQVLTALNTQYQSEAGVSLDEEAIEVMQHQKVYQAASRIVSVALEMVDEVLKIGE